MAESSSPKSEDGSSEESLATAKICTKCGKLAVTGLCNASIQGDMTRDEFFREGTVPTEPCDCHEAITICSESGKVAGPYCPITEKITNVYLKEGTPGTADAENQAGSQENEQSPAGSQENEQSDSGGIEDTFRNWWNDLFS